MDNQETGTVKEKSLEDEKMFSESEAEREVLEDEE